MDGMGWDGMGWNGMDGSDRSTESRRGEWAPCLNI